MSAIVVPFPLCKRVGFLRKQLDYLSALSPSAAERHIRRQIEVQRGCLAAKGVTADQLNAELASLERTMRCDLQSKEHAPGGVR